MNKITNGGFSNVFADHTLRLENLIYLAGVLPSYDGGAVPTSLEEFFDNEPETIIKAFHGRIIAEDEDENDATDFNEDFMHMLIDTAKLGFLAQVATPVMKHKNNSSSYSWGYYRTQWFYGETLDDVAKHAIEWSEQIRADEKKTV